VVAATRVPAGTTLDTWTYAVAAAMPPLCDQSQSRSMTKLGGEPARSWTATCSDGYNVIELAALHGKRGYVLLLPSVTANDDDDDDRPVFESARRSFRFTR
jgi:hypothetical protein